MQRLRYSRSSGDHGEDSKTVLDRNENLQGKQRKGLFAGFVLYATQLLLRASNPKAAKLNLIKGGGVFQLVIHSKIGQSEN